MKEVEVISSFRNIYESFGDQLSKDLYINRVNWLMTGNPQYVETIVKKSHPDIPVWKRCDRMEFVKALPAHKKIIFYGAGNFAECIIGYIKQGLKEFQFCDANVEKQKQGFQGYRVISPEELFQIQEDKCIVICTTKYMNDARNFLMSNGIKKEELFDIRSYFWCTTGDEYFHEDFLHYEEEEIFVDAGCYDLGTTVDFTKVCAGLKKAYAFEPDDKNYSNCMNRIEKEKDSLPEIVMLPYGAWSEKTELHFSATASGSSHIGEGDTVIKTISIDEAVSEEDRITYIKMDIEGAELEALKGAQKVIQRDKPKLAICIYHKVEDVLTIPLYIKSLVPDYKFYLRSYSNAEFEMVLFAIP